ncbi:OmpA family protein [Dyadobacter sp. CY312]|nr:OmpA family protein [Dyadobacter sp. CY312]
MKALTADQTLNIAINGYTDNTGDEKHNLDLSKQRAKTVKTELEKSGIDAKRLVSEGFGQNNPIADNNSEEGKTQNRRVELVKNK